jgi:hypothetical protein
MGTLHLLFNAVTLSGSPGDLTPGLPQIPA